MSEILQNFRALHAGFIFRKSQISRSQFRVLFFANLKSKIPRGVLRRGVLILCRWYREIARTRNIELNLKCLFRLTLDLLNRVPCSSTLGTTASSFVWRSKFAAMRAVIVLFWALSHPWAGRSILLLTCCQPTAVFFWFWSDFDWLKFYLILILFWFWFWFYFGQQVFQKEFSDLPCLKEESSFRIAAKVANREKDLHEIEHFSQQDVIFTFQYDNAFS